MNAKAPAHLRNVIPSVDETPGDDERGLPSLGDGNYRAFARASNKPLYALHFISPQGDVRSFQYMHLDSDSSFTPERIALRFTGIKIMNVVFMTTFISIEPPGSGRLHEILRRIVRRS